jgi:uncharacterized membrane protein
MKILCLEGDPNGITYVSGTLARMGVVHEIVRPGDALPREVSRFQAFVLSDFPSSALAEVGRLVERGVREGLGLLMVGGCRSFGRGGYARSALAPLLPVDMTDGDDRCPAPLGLVLEPALDHPILRDLPWARPPSVAGYNRVAAREQTTTVLLGRAVETSASGIGLAESRVPLLVVKEASERAGRTAALATSLCPPWSGGFTEWGEKRLAVSDTRDVGEDYATFVMNLIRWVAGEATLVHPLPRWDEMELPGIEPQPAMRVRR